MQEQDLANSLYIEFDKNKPTMVAYRHSDGTAIQYAGTVEEIHKAIDEREARIRAGVPKGLALMAAVNAFALGSLSSSRHRTTEHTAKGASAKAKAKRKASRAARKANKQRLKGGK